MSRTNKEQLAKDKCLTCVYLNEKKKSSLLGACYRYEKVTKYRQENIVNIFLYLVCYGDL